MLKIDKKALMNEILRVFTVELFTCLEKWEQDIGEFNSVGGGIPSLASNAKVRYEIRRETNCVIAYLKANPSMLAVAYGTGSLMLQNNPGLEEYKSSKYWNPERRGSAVYGRKAGEYLNIFKGKVVSKGRFRGVNLETKRHPVKLLYPTNSIQEANRLLYENYIPKALRNTIKKVRFSDFIKEVKQ